VHSLKLSLFRWSVLVGEHYVGSELGWVIVLVRGWMVGLWLGMHTTHIYRTHNGDDSLPRLE